MRKYICVLILSVVCFTSCSVGRKADGQAKNEAAESSKAAAEIKTTETVETNKANSAVTKDINDEIKTTKSDCASVNVGDNEVYAKQTFPIDFAPFTNSCFVTAHNPEYDDPPLESEFAVYKDGVKVFDFPSQFNGVEFGCWVEGVAFEDLNGDDLKDIVVAGKCSAKSAPYSENMVYVNTGKAFTTNEDANYKLSDFNKIKEITDFVRRNREIFFK
jgi:hypothetical protein